ncbi:ALP1-like protein [Tanacetum coccineum]
MNPNYDEKEYVSEDDNESDILFMTKALEMHEMMEREEMGQTSNTRQSIQREYDMAEEPGADNDLTILNNSPLFGDLLKDIAHVAPFLVNGVQYEKGYYLADGKLVDLIKLSVKAFAATREVNLLVIVPLFLGDHRSQVELELDRG